MRRLLPYILILIVTVSAALTASAWESTWPFIKQDAAGGQTERPEPLAFRGVWISRWDWSTETDLRQAIRNSARWGFTDIFFQVRGEGDAYYTPGLEPWAMKLTGSLGQDPGWDPLAVVVAEAGDLNLSVHAWINTLAVWQQPEPPGPSEPPHMLHTNPDWTMVDRDGAVMGVQPYGYQFAAPANPGVVEHTVAVARDILARYNVQGLHLDYVRYPAPQFSYDSGTRAKLEAAGVLGTPAEADFHRQQVTNLVSRMKQMKEGAFYRPIMLTAAVFAINRNVYRWPGAMQGFYDTRQDAVRWANEGLVDAVLPMNYWPRAGIDSPKPAFDPVVAYWLSTVPHERLLMGVKTDYEDSEELASQLELLHQRGQYGFVAFSYQGLAKNGTGERVWQVLRDLEVVE